MKSTLQWVRGEWAIVTQRDSMTLKEQAQWFAQWGPFALRTIGYGALSVTLGPLTRRHGASLWAMKMWSRASLRGLNIEARAHETHLFPAGGLMIAANHQSLLDIIVLGAVLPGDFKWVAKESLLRIPFLGWHLALSGHVPVDRKAGGRAAAGAIARFVEVMSAGKSLLIFPEGTRSEDGQLKPFKTGGFYAAVRAQKPVVPVAVDGTHLLMKKGASYTGEGPARQVRVRVGEPIFPKKLGASVKERAAVEQLRDATHAAVAALLTEMRGEAAAGPLDVTRPLRSESRWPRL